MIVINRLDCDVHIKERFERCNEVKQSLTTGINNAKENQEFLDNYATDNPQTATIFSVLVIVITSLFFPFYNLIFLILIQPLIF